MTEDRYLHLLVQLKVDWIQQCSESFSSSILSSYFHVLILNLILFCFFLLTAQADHFEYMLWLYLGYFEGSLQQVGSWRQHSAVAITVAAAITAEAA